MNRKVICALDTSDLDEARSTVARLGGKVGAFKIGHGLVLPHGLDVVATLKEAGAQRIFLDLKFHDIPNSVALAVREASRYGVWAMTLHTAGGTAMMTAAVEEARSQGSEIAPLLIGVSVLTSLDEEMLQQDLGVKRGLSEHMLHMSRLGMQSGLDGAVCSAHEVRLLREELGHEAVLITPGIRPAGADSHDQRRTGTALQALEDGASYLVIGRALTDAPDPDAAMEAMGLLASTGG